MQFEEQPRCPWCGTDALYRQYHDLEWGVPVHDDPELFGFLLLEGAQAGLSWITILRKRARYREVFADFDPAKVARFSAARQARLLSDPGIVRNRLKVAAAVHNARAFLNIQEQHGSFDRWLWRFVGGQPLQNQFQHLAEVPASTALSATISRELVQHGFRFVGPTIIYAFMQAVGMVNDHLVYCFRHAEVARLSGQVSPPRPSCPGPRE